LEVVTKVKGRGPGGQQGTRKGKGIWQKKENGTGRGNTKSW